MLPPTSALSATVRGLASATLLCTVATLVGWYAQVPRLTTVTAGGASMEPATATALALLAVALLARRRASPRPVALAVMALGGVELALAALDAPQGRWEVLLPALDVAGRVRVSPATALALVLIGAALALAGTRPRAVQALAVSAFAVAYAALLGFAFAVEDPGVVVGLSGMAVHTAACLAALSVAVLCVDGRGGLVVLLRERGSAGQLMRTMVPFLLLVPPALGWLRLRGEQLGWFDGAFGLALLVMGMTVSGGVVVWVSATRLRLLDQARADSAVQLARGNAALEDAVSARTAELQQAAERVEALVQLAPVGILELDARGAFLSANDRYLTLTGLTPEQATSRGWSRVVHPLDRPRVISQWTRAVRRQEAFEDVIRLVLADGRVRTVKVSTTPVRDSSGAVVSHLAAVTDLTAQRSAEARFEAAFASSPLASALVDLEGTIAQANRQLGVLMGRDQSELVGMRAEALFDDGDQHGSAPRFAQLASGALTSERRERPLREGAREGTWVDTAVSAIIEGEECVGYLYKLTDVTARRLAEARAEHLALHDPLTDLPHRLLLLDRLEQALEQSRRRGGGVGVLFLDLDRFKVVNDSLGHQAGDAVLVEVARRLRAQARRSDTVARMGGDEFVVLCPDVTDERDLRAVAESLRQAVARPITISGQVTTVDASIGISVGFGHEEPDVLLRNADQAMYDAKDQGRARASVFDPALRGRIEQRLDVELGLRAAVHREEIETWFQPIVDLQADPAGGVVVANEALARWRRGHDGLVMPTTFIPVAEETGLITEVGSTVLAQACLAAAAVPDGPVVSVNVSARQFVHEDLVAAVERALALSGLPADRLWVELTESTVVQAIDTSARAFQSLRAQGVKIAIDDFGTGFSSFLHLRSFAVDLIKIDMTFVRDIERSAHDRAIVEGIVRLAEALELDVVAEGIETTGQRDLLRDLGCRYGQGYLFARPSPVFDPPRVLAPMPRRPEAPTPTPAPRPRAQGPRR